MAFRDGLTMSFVSFLSQELRDSYEKQLADNRDEFTRVYDDKIASLQKKLDHERINNSGEQKNSNSGISKVGVGP